MPQPKSNFRFPWRTHNHFRLLVDGDEFYPAMLEAIESARHFIYLEMYLFESGSVTDRFIDKLTRARARNVEVYLLLDDYGAQGLESVDRDRMANTGMRLCFYNPWHYGRLRRSLLRDHRKLLLIDGHTAFTGGAGITDDFDRRSHPRLQWHEAMIRISGPCVQDWQCLFEETWQRSMDEDLRLPIHDFPIQGEEPQRGRVVENSRLTHAEVVRSFINHIRNTHHRCWLATAYFVPSRKLRRTLQRSARQGRDVRLLLPGPHSDHPWARHMGRRYYHQLLIHGVRIFEYQPRFTHMKVLLCDNWVSVGSSNVDRWNFRWNLEANQEVSDRDFAQSVQEQFEEDFEHCHEILLEHWRQRPWHTRLREWFWSRIAIVLSRFSYGGWLEQTGKRKK